MYNTKHNANDEIPNDFSRVDCEASSTRTGCGGRQDAAYRGVAHILSLVRGFAHHHVAHDVMPSTTSDTLVNAALMACAEFHE